MNLERKKEEQREKDDIKWILVNSVEYIALSHERRGRGGREEKGERKRGKRGG